MKKTNRLGTLGALGFSLFLSYESRALNYTPYSGQPFLSTGNRQVSGGSNMDNPLGEIPQDFNFTGGIPGNLTRNNPQFEEDIGGKLGEFVKEKEERVTKKEELVCGTPSQKRPQQKKLIILDPGHGGIDPGAKVDGVSEDEVAYDIAVRVRKLLIKEGYQVHQTVYDRKTKFEPVEKLVDSKEEFLVAGDGPKTKLKRKLLEKRRSIIDHFYSSKSKPLLVSIHVNSVVNKFSNPAFDFLFDSVQGVRIYYPSEKTYGSREVEEKSEKLAETIKGALEEHDISTYSFNFWGLELSLLDDVLDFDRFKLAVFKTRLEEKVLIECGNLQNKEDQQKLLDPREREKIARAISEGMVSYIQEQ